MIKNIAKIAPRVLIEYIFADLLIQILDFRGEKQKKRGMEWDLEGIPALSANNGLLDDLLMSTLLVNALIEGEI